MIQTSFTWQKPPLRQRLKAAINRRGHLAAALLAAFGVAWTVTEAASFFFTAAEDKRGVLFISLVLTVAVGGLITAIPAARLRLRFGSSIIELGFGDLLAADGVLVVAVNDFIDSELGDHVSPTSLHGQLIASEFAGDSELFASAVHKALSDVDGENVARSGGRATRYPVGTTAVVDTSGHRWVLVVLAVTDEATLKVRADLEHLARALGAGEIFKLILADDRMRALFTDYLAQTVYDRIRLND